MKRFALILALLASPAVAQECVMLDQAMADAEAVGGYLIDLVDIEGETADQLAFFAIDGKVLMVGVSASGCMIAPIVPVDTIRVEPAGVPA